MTAPAPDGPIDHENPVHVTYVIGTYPLLTTTFIDREIRSLRDRGIRVEVLSLRRPGTALSPDQVDLAATVSYLRPLAPTEVIRAHVGSIAASPGRYLGILVRVLTARGQTLRGRIRTAGHFVVAVAAARRIELLGRPRRLHAHFVDRAALVAHVAAGLLGIPYSVTGHAVDIYRDPELLTLKLAHADLVTTCTDANRRHLEAVAPEAASKVRLAYHGIDLERYQPVPSPTADVPTILAIGQLKEKKGLIHLIAACRILRDRGRRFRCEIVGEGPERDHLERAVSDAGLGGTVTLLGARPHPEVIDAYRRASVFTLPCIVGSDGDRDGIPNVMLEAMAMGLPVVSTPTSGIPEVVADGGTGRLVTPGDATALADALDEMLVDPERARAMGGRGRERVVESFDIARNTEMLARHFAGATR